METTPGVVKVGITISRRLMGVLRAHVATRKAQGQRDSISAFFERAARALLHKEARADEKARVARISLEQYAAAKLARDLEAAKAALAEGGKAEAGEEKG